MYFLHLTRQPAVTSHIGIQNGGELAWQTAPHAEVPFFELRLTANTTPGRGIGGQANGSNRDKDVRDPGFRVRGVSALADSRLSHCNIIVQRSELVQKAVNGKNRPNPSFKGPLLQCPVWKASRTLCLLPTV